MRRLSPEEESQLLSFIKDWLKTHGYNQKDLASKLNLKSSRTSEVLRKMQEIYKKGGIFNIAKKLIEIEQIWLNINKKELIIEKKSEPYNQLDLDTLVNQIETESSN